MFFIKKNIDRRRINFNFDYYLEYCDLFLHKAVIAYTIYLTFRLFVLAIRFSLTMFTLIHQN